MSPDDVPWDDTPDGYAEAVLSERTWWDEDGNWNRDEWDLSLIHI